MNLHELRNINPFFLYKLILLVLKRYHFVNSCHEVYKYTALLKISVTQAVNQNIYNIYILSQREREREREIGYICIYSQRKSIIFKKKIRLFSKKSLKIDE